MCVIVVAHQDTHTPDRSISEAIFYTRRRMTVNHIKAVAHAMREPIKQLRAQVNEAMKLSSRHERRSQLRHAHTQLRWLVPLHRAMVALGQQPDKWDGSNADAHCVLVCVRIIEELQRQIRSCSYNEPTQLGPIVSVALPRARKGVAPSQWEVVTLVDLVESERYAIVSHNERRKQALRDSEETFNHFLQSLKPEQQLLLRESMLHAASVGSYNLVINVDHFKAMGVEPSHRGIAVKQA